MTNSERLSNSVIILVCVLFLIPFFGIIIRYSFSMGIFIYDYNSNEYNYATNEFLVNYRLTLLGILVSMALVVFLVVLLYWRCKRVYKKE